MKYDPLVSFSPFVIFFEKQKLKTRVKLIKYEDKKQPTDTIGWFFKNFNLS